MIPRNLILLTFPDTKLTRADYTLEEFKSLAKNYPQHCWTKNQVISIAGPLYEKGFSYGDLGVEDRMAVFFLLQVDLAVHDETVLGFMRTAGEWLMRDHPRCPLKAQAEIADTFLPAIKGKEHPTNQG